ncbi:Gfo/Idh/MocA family protein [Niabella drilacis]|uniref:Predicted dehydrogenase n=1 Tax=Niabella drilacis (strain DSM 25811 / CCM 8410 / CCUG 62505 / LMG 26954 / E90) TaxID=1285928 RepID=A0A1G6NPX7_NIADE|nr:Gfo/Idh/MocA family oxidoreductase [Niabella drilacis]SDC69943.1 Predicted dehydrogenase [Niabella drilacis]
MGEKVRFAVVGYGHMGKRHAKVIREHPDCELMAIVDIQDLSGDHIEPFYNSLDCFLESAIAMGTDVMIIASPNGLHAQHALRCLAAKKHVLIEKPMALNKTDAEAIVTRAAEVQKQVFVMMQNRFSPVSVWLKELTDSGVLGNIYLIQVNCFWNRDGRYYKKGNWHGTSDLDGGTLFTQFSHFIDLIYWCFGDITNIRSNFRNFNHEGIIDFEDTGLVHFDLIKGGVGSLSYTTAVWDQNLESSITVIAEKGSVKVSGQYMDKVEYCHVDNYQKPDINTSNLKGGNGTEFTEAEINHQNFIHQMLCSLRGESPEMTLANEGEKVVGMIERIYNN